MNPQIIYNMPERDYRAHPGLNQSFLKSLSCPSKAKAELDGVRKKTSSGFKIGTLAHTLFLTPDRFLSKYTVGPDINKNTKEYRAIKEAALTAGMEVIDSDELETAQGIVKSIQRNSSVAEIISEGFESEVAMFGEIRGFKAKALVDLLPRSPAWNRCLVDLKTCAKADKESFQWSILDFGYHIQASWYINLALQNGIDALAFLIIAVETEPPFDVAVYEIDDRALAKGAEDIERYLQIYKQCTESGIWPGYPSEIQSIGLPEKAYRNQ